MSEINSRWQDVTDRAKWAARGASFAAKVKATKQVWFPPGPVETGEKTASTGKRATKTAKTATKKATKTATKKATRAAKKPRAAAARK